MELLKWNGNIKAWISKYKYVMAVLLIGVLLMLIPARETVPVETIAKEPNSAVQSQDLASELSEILEGIQGAGNVKVVLSVAEGEKTIYQTDSTYTQSEANTSSKTQTILITDSDRNQAGLIYQMNPPVYRGAVVLSQGADEPTVRLAIVDAVGKATGLGADKIAVLKMK